jgi:hypothetical protein
MQQVYWTDFTLPVFRLGRMLLLIVSSHLIYLTFQVLFSRVSVHWTVSINEARSCSPLYVVFDCSSCFLPLMASGAVFLCYLGSRYST